jgi:uridine kinase
MLAQADSSATSKNATPKKVIGICGPPGCGKSTLARMLQGEIAQARRIDIDDYQSFTEQTLAELDQWVKDGADYNKFQLPELVAALDNHPAATPLIFETHFGRGHQASGRYIDTLIWIDVPLDIALARNLQTFIQQLGDTANSEANPEQLSWLTQYLQGYTTSIRHTLTLQRQYIRPGADIFLDGTQPTELLCQQAIQQLAAAKYL